MSIFLMKWHLRKWSVDERTFEAVEDRKLENREAQIFSYSYLPFSSPYDYYRKRKKESCHCEGVSPKQSISF